MDALIMPDRKVRPQRRRKVPVTTPCFLASSVAGIKRHLWQNWIGNWIL